MKKTALFLLVLLFGCSPVKESVEIKDAEIPSGTWLTYEGILPCEDCGGIKTTLDIYIDYGDPNPPYVVTEVYLGKNNGTPVVTEGTYNTLRGTDVDPDATVLELDYDKPERLKYLVRVGNEAIRLLSSDAKEMTSEQNYTLQRIQ